MSVKKVTRSDGTVAWDVRWREGDRQRRRRFTRKTDADQWDRERTILRERGGLPAMSAFTGEGITLTSWVVEHWGPQHAAALAKSTRVGYAYRWATQIEPYLGTEKLRDLTVSRIRAWQTELLADGQSAKSVIKARTVLSSVLRHAAEAEQIAGNPMQIVRPPKAEHTDEIIPLTPLEVETIRARLDLQARTIHTLLAYGGLRPGELRGLQWGDLRESTIRVQRAADPEGELKTTKTRSNRSVPVWPALRDDLAAWRAQAKKTGARSPVFPGAGGGQWTVDDWGNFRSRVWVPLAREVTGRRPRLYDLRHTCASLLLAAGRTPTYVAKVLGHSQEMTLSTYGHVIDDLEAGTERIDLDEAISTARATATESVTNASSEASDNPGCHLSVTSPTDSTSDHEEDH